MEAHEAGRSGDEGKPREARATGVALVAVLTVFTALINVPRLLHLIGQPLNWILVLGWIPVVQVAGILVIGVGLWLRQDWARNWAICIYGFLLLLQVTGMLRQPIDGLSLAVIVVYGLVIIYLLLPGTRNRFET